MTWARLLIFLVVALPAYGDETSNATTILTTVTQAPNISTTTPLTTTVSPTVEIPTTPTPLPSKRTAFLNTTSYSCGCDSTITCDVNCCCDIDCSEEFIKAFRCLDEAKIEHYHYGEGLERCEIDKGLFCIIQDNLGSRSYLPAPGYAEYSNYRWMDSSHVEPNIKVARELYKFGDEIVMFDMRSETVGAIEVPGSSSCLKEPIKFLHSTSVKCLKTLNDLCSSNSDFLAKLVNSQCLCRPSPTDKKEVTHGFSIKIQSCKQNFVDCTPFDAEVEGIEAFDELQLEFLVNDTSLVSGTASVIMNDDVSCNSDDLEPHAKVVQTFVVKFQNINEKREKRVRTRSRGYKDEELIYISRQFLQNESIPNGNTFLEYFRENYTDTEDFSLKIPKNFDGKCVLTKDEYDLVRFNENSLTFCKVLIDKNETLNETFCQQVQLQISNYVFNLLNLTFNGTSVSYASNVLVSKYYQPNYEAWVKLNFLGIPPVSPELQTTATNKQFCTNIFREVKFSFYSTRKNVIEKLNVEFGTSDFFLPMDTDNQTVSADISIKCQFFNLDYNKNTD